MTLKLSGPTLIRGGETIITFEVLVLVLILAFEHPVSTVIGLVVIGLGCAIVYTCAIHFTSEYFGADQSKVIVSLQMEFAYTGKLVIPLLAGMIT